MSVVAAGGFRAAGVATGVKPGSELDLAVVAVGETTGVAALFTTNQAAAAPVRLSRRHLTTARARAVVINSGCANAATGPTGEAAAVATAVRAASALGCEPEEVLVASTGQIGTRLPLDRLLPGVDAAVDGLSASAAAGDEAAVAILTTDTVTKQVVVNGDGFVVGGMAKGAGMVRPDMATMLVVLTTDAVASDGELDAALRPAVEVAFHGLNIDGCPSTNDMVAILASGASGVQPDPAQLAGAVGEACDRLARQLAADAEGASRVVLIQVRGTATDDAARAAGRAIADSALVRASFFGGDPNWGRILGALGSGPVEFDPLLVDVAYEGVAVAKSGEAVDFDEREVTAKLTSGDFTVTVNLGEEPGSATVTTADLTPDYVRFNAEPS